MDMLKINSVFTNKLISRILSKYIKKATGYDVKIFFNNLSIVFDNDLCTAHVDADVKTDKNTLTDICKKMNEES